MDRIIEIQTPFGRDLSFVNMLGYESLSELFEFTLTLTSKNPNLASDQIIGQRATVVIDTNSGTRPLNGLVTDFGYLSEDPDEESYHLYSAVLRPNLWYLTQRYDSRVFVNKDILQISQTLLDELGITYEIRCQNSYRSYGQSTQYQETSFGYLSRLFEQEGIYYYFEHSEGNNTLILVDDNSAHPAIQGDTTLPYHPKTSPGTPHQSYIDAWQQMDRLTTKKVNINDHNYQTSKSKLTSSGSTHDLGGISTEHFDYYTNFKDKDQASHYQQIRSQDYNAKSKRIHAQGNVLTIAPGRTFSLLRHPRYVANTEHLIISATYDLQEAGYTSGKELSHYRIEFVVIPKSVQYRTPRLTPKPQVIGTQGATVTGPAGEEVHTNEYGDIKVQFHWDRYGPMNGKSSDWIRVTQGSAGEDFGSVNTPRIGEEVLIDFINGDSDRPIVVGRLYNSGHRPPWGYPEAAMQSGIKSKSFNSPLENFNELMFNDRAGEELVNFQAQKDLVSLVKNDETRTVNNDRTTTIDNDETVTVHGFRVETVDKDETITIHQNRTETVDLDETITIHENRKERVDIDETISIGGDRQETVEKSESVTVQGNQDLTVEKNQKESINKSRTLKVKKDNKEHVSRNKSVTVNMAYATQVGAVMNTAVGLLQAEEVGGMKKTIVGKSYSITVGDKFEISVGDSKLTMTTDSISITSKSILVAAEKSNTIIGKNVEINPLGEASAGGEDKSSAASTSKQTRLPEALAALEAGRADASSDAVNDPNVGTNLDAPMLGSNGEGVSGFGNYNPHNPDNAWDPEVNTMMPKRNDLKDDKDELPSTARILPNMFPRASSHLVKDENYAALLDRKADMRNVTYAGAAIAGYTPYIVTGGKEAAALLPQSAINSASSNAALGALSYVATTPSEQWDPGKALIYTAGGAITGGVSSAATTATEAAVINFSGMYFTQYATGEEVDLFATGINGLGAGALKPYNLGLAGDIVQTVTTSAAGELSKSKEFKEESAYGNGLFWTK